MSHEPEIREYNGEFTAVADIFYGAIHRVACNYYAPEQIHAWAPLPIQYDRWEIRCQQKRPWLYCQQEEVRGFIELEADGHIDCHYVHPDYNRQGIGAALLDHVVQLAQTRRHPRLFVEASHIAKGLYQKHGFAVVRSNLAVRDGVSIPNWIMERVFSDADE